MILAVNAAGVQTPYPTDSFSECLLVRYSSFFPLSLKVGIVEHREGPSVEKAAGEPPPGCSGSQSILGERGAEAGPLQLAGKSEERGPWKQVPGQGGC